MKLLSVALSSSPHGLRPPLNYLQLGAPGPYKDWTAKVKGGAVYLISPPGWRPGAQPQGTVRRVIEVPRTSCMLQWEAGPGEMEDEPVRGVDSPAAIEAKIESGELQPTLAGAMDAAATVGRAPDEVLPPELQSKPRKPKHKEQP